MKRKYQYTDLNNVYCKRFYRIIEIVGHTKRDDLWMILDKRVLDLSQLTKSLDQFPTSGKDLLALHQLHMFGGTDITELVRNPKNNLEMFDLKSRSEYGKINNLYWWNDPMYVIGSITSQERHVCIRNKTNGTIQHMEVAEEDSIYEIRAKYIAANANDNSDNMLWRKTESTCCPDGHLYLDKTLTGNGLIWNPKDEVNYLWIFHKDQYITCSNFF